MPTKQKYWLVHKSTNTSTCMCACAQIHEHLRDACTRRNTHGMVHTWCTGRPWLPTHLQNQVFWFCCVDGATLFCNIVVRKPVSLAPDAVCMPELRIVICLQRRPRGRIEGGGVVPLRPVVHDMPIQSSAHLRLNGKLRRVACGKVTRPLEDFLRVGLATDVECTPHVRGVVVVDLSEFQHVAVDDLATEPTRVFPHVDGDGVRPEVGPHAVHVPIHVVTVLALQLHVEVFTFTWRRDAVRELDQAVELHRHFVRESFEDGVPGLSEPHFLVKAFPFPNALNGHWDAKLVHLGCVDPKAQIVVRELVPIEVHVQIGVCGVHHVGSREADVPIDVDVDLDIHR
mmetsp:Transcript_75101/g.126415  ORF Transcript_75101/g.126415 Transcript_75101/m.126415 type:complete len:342 (-) Transcript_75101:760-1785(-)